METTLASLKFGTHIKNFNQWEVLIDSNKQTRLERSRKPNHPFCTAVTSEPTHCFSKGKAGPKTALREKDERVTMSSSTDLNPQLKYM